MGGKGKLLGIATRPVRHAPMQEAMDARITLDSGVNVDARGKPGRRQVTVISREAWEAACAELGVTHLPWTTRRANLLVDGIDLQAKIGYELRLGDAVLKINGETRPCEVMEQAYPGLKAALTPEWRGGVICRVMRPGEVTVGCEVVLTRNVVRQATSISSHHGRKILKQGRAMLGDWARKLGLKKPRQATYSEHQ
ncbi:MAG TPA: MOSC domain-containing protein [Pyrinomonadaceae bacterium]|nr:MOSC domain-containing protein [Pyrinomonadaceae bacterium]